MGIHVMGVDVVASLIAQARSAVRFGNIHRAG
jgi:hypothetical protein